MATDEKVEIVAAINAVVQESHTASSTSAASGRQAMLPKVEAELALGETKLLV